MGDGYETIPDILKEWRGYAHGMPGCARVAFTYHTFRKGVLDRIEAAWKRAEEEGGEE